MVLKNNNNKNCNYTLDNINNKLLAGGLQKKCKIINRLEASIEKILTQSGISMEEYLNVKSQKVDRTKFPIVLNPETATFDDVAIHGMLRQRLGPSTVAKNITYACYMEAHCCPVNFRHPDYENFIRHMDYENRLISATGKVIQRLLTDGDLCRCF